MANTQNFDAIVIGSGIGGLGVAALLSKAGKKILVLERHTVAGGFTHTFSRKGYEWDVGVHYIGDVHRTNSHLRLIFDDISDGQLQWARMDPVYDRVYFKDESYDLVSGIKNYEETLCRYFPEERKAIQKYIEYVKKSAHASGSFFVTKSLPPLLSKILSPFLRRKFLKYSDQTTLQVLSKLTQNKKLIGVLSAQYGDYGLPPSKSSFAIQAMVANHYFDGGNYPVGGSSQFAATLIPAIEKRGGKVQVRSEVKEIVLQNGKAVGVKLASGDEVMAPRVISDIGVYNTFCKLLPASLRPKMNIARSLSHICLYLGFKESADSLRFPKTNLWIYPDYDHDENLRRYLNDPASPLPVTYISFPSAKDPTWDKNHPHRATMEVIGVAPYCWFKKWEDKPWGKRGEDYSAFKKELSERLLQNVYHYLPNVKGKIDYMELSTPLSTRLFCNYDQGEIYGLDHTPERFRQTWLKPQTSVPNLFLTGQDIVTDGIGGALFASVLTASVILKKNVMNEIQRRRNSN